MIRTVSIVGAGIGAQHLAGYQAVRDRFAVHSICDLDAQRGGVLAQNGDCAYIKDYKYVLADPQVDIVDICLPPHLHYDAVMAALDADKIVVCEKPLVASLAEADRLIVKAGEVGGTVAPVFQYRYGLGTAQLQALIAAGLAGRCYAGTLETHWNRPASYYDIQWRGTWAGERGGALLGHAIHIHDLLPWLIGPVAQVFADTATRVNDIEVEDCAALSIRMGDGALISSSVTLGGGNDTSRMRLLFEGFTVESDHAPYSLAEKGWRFIARSPREQAEVDEVLAQVGEARSGYAGMFEALADALDGTGGREVTLEDGRRSLEFVTACYASARANAPVTLPLGPGHALYDGWMPDAAS